LGSAGTIYIQFTARTDAFDKRMDRMVKKLNRHANRIKRLGRDMTYGFTVPLLGLAMATVMASANYETAFAGVRKTVNATGTEFRVLTEDIRGMSREVPASVVQISSVAEAAGQLGIKTKNIKSFSRVMIDLGETTDMAAADAAKSLARLANITQMPQSKFDRLGSTVVNLGNNLATTESEIVDMGLRIAGAGSVVGMTEHQILSFAGAMSSVGVESQAGGTAVSTMVVNIAKAVENGGAKLKDFASVAGMSANEFKIAFKTDAADAIADFITGLGQVNATGGNVFGTLEKLELTEKRLQRALLSTAQAGELVHKSLELGRAGWRENNALTKEAGLRYATFASKVKILRNRITDISATFGGPVKATLSDLIDDIGPLLNKVDKIADGFARLNPTVRKHLLVLTAVTAAIGPAAMAVGFLGKGYVAVWQLLPKLSTGLKLVGKATAGVSRSILTKLVPSLGAVSLPVLLIIGALVVAVGAWYKWRDQITKAVVGAYKATKTWLVGGFNTIFDKVREGLNKVLGFFDGLWTGITGTVAGIYNSVKTWLADNLGGVFNWIGKALSKVIGFFHGLYVKVSAFLGKTVDGLKTTLGEVKEFAKETGTALAGATEKIAKVTWAGVKGVGEGLKMAGADLGKLLESMVGPLPDKFHDMLGSLFQSKAAGGADADSGPLGSIARSADDAGNKLDDLGKKSNAVIKGIEDASTSWASGFTDAIANMVKTGKLEFRSLADSIISDLIRIQVQAAVTNPLSKFLSGLWSGGPDLKLAGIGPLDGDSIGFGSGIIGLPKYERDGPTGIDMTVNVVENSPIATSDVKLSSDGKTLDVIIGDIVGQQIASGKHNRALQAASLDSRGVRR